jgi:adenylate cyclase
MATQDDGTAAPSANADRRQKRKERRQAISKAALGLAVGALPGELVRQVASATAPLGRYGGRSKVTAATLARALQLLAQPPAAHRAAHQPLTLEVIADRIDRDAAEVRRWARAGLLGPSPGQGRKWPPGALERALLADYLLRHGVKEDALLQAAAENRLGQLVLGLTIAGQGIYDAGEAAAEAEVPVELAVRFWHALGLPLGEPEEDLYTDRDIEALRLVGAMRGIYTDDDLVEAASVVGRAMHEVAEASVELFRRRLSPAFAEAGVGELEMALRLASLIDLTVPATSTLLETVFRRQLENTGRSETVMSIERATGELSDGTELAIGFADIIGFTSLSSKLNPLELSELAAKLLHCAEKTLPQRGARVVKSIGDAVMFTARDEVMAAAAAAALLQASREVGLPELHVGIARGPVLHAYADYFGRTVNVASRLCDAAKPGAILVLEADPVPAPEAWRKAGLDASPGRRLGLKGIDGRVRTLEVRPAPTR